MSFDGEPQAAAVPKLPLWNTICGAYSTWFSNPLDVLRISWLWLLLAALINWAQWTSTGGIIADAVHGAQPHVPIGISLLLDLGNLFLVLGFSSVAVAWHRRIILDERPRLSGANVFTRNLWCYLGAGILITLTAWIPMLLLFLIVFVFSIFLKASGVQGSLGVVTLIPVAVLFYLVSIAVVLRLSVLLPARATGDFGRTFKEAWRRTRGNTWRIFWGMLACTLPMLLILAILVFMVIGFPTAQSLADGSFNARVAAANPILFICYLLMLPVGIGFLSLSYLHFFGRYRPAQLR